LSAPATARAWTSFDEHAFAARFREVQDGFRRGKLRKAVPVVFENSRGPLTAAERERALRALANLPSGLMPYGTWDSDGGILGAAPELLFENDGVEIHTGLSEGDSVILSNPAALIDGQAVEVAK
jgi:menaquinone-specific isochorismate synthase